MRPTHAAVIARRTIRCFKAGTHASHIRPIFGQYYGDPKGAEGPMQFEPATFAEYAVRADPSAPLTPYDPKDAIFTAARMLCADGAWGASRPGLERAIFAYNHACWYVRDVLAIASRYATAAHAGHHVRRHPPRRHGRHRRQARQARHRRPPPRRHRSHVRSRPDPSAHALCAGSGQYPAPGE